MKNNIISLCFIFCIHFVSALEFVDIPSGTYIMGTKNMIFSSSGTTDMIPDSLYTPHNATIDAFKISKYEIDSALFRSFLETNGKNIFDTNNIYELLLRYNSPQYDMYPAVSTYFYALDFCEWLSKKTGHFYRLPTEAEWEYVATGGDGRNYPWGNEYKSLGKTINESLRLPLNSYAEDISPFGVMNMFGNVSEWVLDFFQYDFYTQKNIINPISIDGRQISVDGNYEYPPLFSVRGKNGYHYDLHRIEIPVDEFATVKRRYSEWHNSFNSGSENIGFRIVEYSTSNILSSHGKKNIVYDYDIFISRKKAPVYLYANDTSPVVGYVDTNEKVQKLFHIRDGKKTRWIRIHKFNFYTYTEGVKRGDDSISGWLQAF